MPPLESKFFHFHAVFGKKMQNNRLARPFSELAHPLKKILDLPLLSATIVADGKYIFSTNACACRRFRGPQPVDSPIRNREDSNQTTLAFCQRNQGPN